MYFLVGRSLSFLREDRSSGVTVMPVAGGERTIAGKGKPERRYGWIAPVKTMTAVSLFLLWLGVSLSG